MYAFKYLISLFIILLTSTFSWATMYEDAEDNKTAEWSLLKSDTRSIIKNVEDKNKNSQVIQLIGQGTRSVYILTLAPKTINEGEHLLSWEMNYAEDFVLIVELDTDKGRHTLIYTPGDINSHLQYGLGSLASNGQWTKYERNLKEDLNNFIKDSKILTINKFVIKGSGLLDNIQLINPSNVTKNQEVKKESDNKQNGNPKVKDKKQNNVANSMPVIYLNGKNPVLLEKGQTYVEAGATAIDKSGLELDIEISHQIDIFKEGEYSVIYLTTNEQGNSVIDKRRVIVGELSEEEQVKVQEVINSNVPDELEERSKELSAWEQALQTREKELQSQSANKEPPVNQNIEGSDIYPKRPGL